MKNNQRTVKVEFVEAPQQLNLRLIAIAFAEKIKQEEGQNNDRRKQV